MPNSNSSPGTLGHASLPLRSGEGDDDGGRLNERDKLNGKDVSSNGNIPSANNNGDSCNNGQEEEEGEENEESTCPRSVIIVGGGISGLIAAYVLVEKGFEVTLLEAQDRVGGRIHSLHQGEQANGIAELGAQWIHGQEGNPVYKFALDHDLIAQDPDPDDEKHGFYCTNTGQVIDSDLVNLTLNELDKIKEHCSSLTTDQQYTSLEDIFRSRFNQFKLSQVNKSTDLKVMVDQRKSKECSNETNKSAEEREKLEDKITREEGKQQNKLAHKLGELTLIPRESVSIDAICTGFDDDLKVMDALLEWYFTFEKIDNACDKFSSLSIRGYTEYIDCSGFPLINLKNGYDSVINAICLKIPPKCIRLNHQVNTVTYSRELCQTVVHAQNKSTKDAQEIKFQADHCILTVSLGVLKSDSITFNPPLPKEKIDLINAMGFGTINKIFLEFDSPFWPVNSRFAIKLVWLEKNSDSKYPSWVYDMTGFDVSRNHKSTLIGWIGGQGARDIESESEETISTVCHNLLKQFLGSNLIRKPVKVFCSKWFTNCYFLGSYSHPTRQSEALSLPNSILSDPVWVKLPNGHMVPRVIIAGEATDPEYFSTTHGAFRSGERAAQQLIQFQCDIKAMKNKPKRPMN